MFELLACEGALVSQPCQPIYEHGAQPEIESVIFLEGRKTLVALEKTTAQLYSHMAIAGNQTRATVVRGERFTY